jgi:hypothetical protein
MKRSNKHQNLVDNYDQQKSKHLEKLTNQILKIDETNFKLKNKPLKKDIFKFFK